MPHEPQSTLRLDNDHGDAAYDYEALPESAGHLAHMLAGAVAGVAEHTATYPLDLVKTRLQLLAAPPDARYAGVRHALRQIASAEGPAVLWRGVPAVFAGAGPAHAVYFTMYEAARSTLSSSSQTGHVSATVAALSGCVACVAHDAIMNPFDVVKQRMQAAGSAYASTLQCAASVWRREGLRAFYVSYPASVATSLPFQAVHFAVYEKMSQLLNQRREYSPLAHLTAGAAAGSIAAAATTPLDTLRTILQTKGDASDHEVRKVRGLRDAARLLVQRHGVAGFFRGVWPRMATYMPSTAVCWCTYEYIKSVLKT